MKEETWRFRFPRFDDINKPHLSWDQRRKDYVEIPKAELRSVFHVDLETILQKPTKKTKTIGLDQFIPSIKQEITQNLTNGSESSPIKNGSLPNRIIHGDSLIGMACLLAEGYKNQIQMIYIDPPFGIQYEGKFTSSNQVLEGYIDNWKNGLASYLNYLRERLVLCFELLKDEGSIFLQIGEHNLHYVRCLLDEIFGPENFVSQITFRTAISTNKIENVADYLLWYAKNKPKMFRRKLFSERSQENIEKTFTYSDEKKNFKPQELVVRLRPKSKNKSNRTFPIEYQGNSYVPPEGYEWKWDLDAMKRLIEQNRIVVINKKLYGKRFLEDFSSMLLTNIWTDTSTSTFAASKHYTVHTNPKVIIRCIAMTSMPNDLILDPTSGSGTTAFCAEKLGRKWIVFDTSPAAIISTISILCGHLYPIYEWDVEKKDYIYESFSKISLSDLSKNAPSTSNYKYDSPKINNKDGRFASAFTLDLFHNIFSDSWKESLICALKKNGLFVSSEQNIKIKSLELLKNSEFSSSFEKYNFLFLNAITDNEEKITIISGPPACEMPLIDLFNKIPLYLTQNPQEKLIILAGHYPVSFLKEISNIQESYPDLVLFGILHPDLWVNDLDFKNHPEAAKIIGKIIQTPLLSSNFDFISEKSIALWLSCSSKCDDSLQTDFNKNVVITLQIPFYKLYMADSLKPLLSNLPSNKETLENLQIQIDQIIKSNDWNLLCYDIRGTPILGVHLPKTHEKIILK